MPHYRDGTAAEVGDLVRGKTYNRKGVELVGTVVSITPGAQTCNCIVAFATVTELKPLPGTTWYEIMATLGVHAQLTARHDGSMVVIRSETDYGETQAFELIAGAARPGAVAA